jgi:ankyrin repeat protein
MPYTEDSPFHRLLATKYAAEREDEAIEILNEHPEIARLEWPGPDSQGQPFVRGSTALHYAANDGKLRLIRRLIECGADVNASSACWFRSVLSWAANGARVETIRFLLAHGARPDSLDALHAAAWGGSDRGKGNERAYAESLKLLVAAGANMNDRRHCDNRTPLAVALESGNTGAIEYLRSLGAEET